MRVRYPRLIRRGTAGVIALLVVGAFLAWGPVGLGNGPLSMGSGGETGNADLGRSPVGVIIPVVNLGHAPAVIEAVRFLGGAGYQGPTVFALRAIAYTTCAGGVPLGATPQARTVRAQCGIRDLGTLFGHEVPASADADSPVMEAIADVRPPRANSCWALTAIVVHYRVGFRHYAATSPDAFVICRGRARSQLQAAMDAAGAAAP